MVAPQSVLRSALAGHLSDHYGHLPACSAPQQALPRLWTTAGPICRPEAPDVLTTSKLSIPTRREVELGTVLACGARPQELGRTIASRISGRTHKYRCDGEQRRSARTWLQASIHFLLPPSWRLSYVTCRNLAAAAQRVELRVRVKSLCISTAVTGHMLLKLPSFSLSYRARTLSTPRYRRIRALGTRLRDASGVGRGPVDSYVREAIDGVAGGEVARTCGVHVVVALALVTDTQGPGTYRKDTATRWAWGPPPGVPLHRNLKFMDQVAATRTAKRLT